jgi:hypothetical protein
LVFPVNSGNAIDFPTRGRVRGLFLAPKAR